MNICTRPQFWWRAALVAAGVLGFLTGDHRMRFYTTQSNIIVLGYYAGVLYWMARRRTVVPAAPRLRGAVTLWIAVTGLVAHFVLNHGTNPLPGLVHGDAATVLAARSTFLLHYVVPAMALIDWAAFGPRRAVRWRDLPLWLCYPLAYGLAVLFTSIAFPAVPDRYPYFFIDPTGHGYGWVTLQLLLLCGEIAALGAAVIGLDRLVSRPAARSGPSTTVHAFPTAAAPSGDRTRT